MGNAKTYSFYQRKWLKQFFNPPSNKNSSSLTHLLLLILLSVLVVCTTCQILSAFYIFEFYLTKYNIKVEYFAIICIAIHVIILNIRSSKDYLRCKTIFSQNVRSEAQAKNFFFSQRSYVPFSRYSSFCIFKYPMIYQICDAMMSISTWDRVHIWTYPNSLSHQTWPIDRYKQRK